MGAKFREDLSAAPAQVPQPEAFVFLTNVNLTVGEKAALILDAQNRGLALSDRWMIIRPPISSLFHIAFGEKTPRRFYKASDIATDANWSLLSLEKSTLNIFGLGIGSARQKPPTTTR